MKSHRNPLRGLFVLLIFALPLAASALTVVDIDQDQLETWISTGEEVTVPTGTAYKLALSDGDSVVIGENTLFKVTRKNDIERIVLLSGTVVVDRVGEDGDLFEIEADGQVIRSDGADLIVTSGDDGTEISQFSELGTVTVNGSPIENGAGGMIGGDGTFTATQSVSARLGGTATQLLRSISTPRGPRPPYERMKPFPRKIVQENLNDISPS